jgi:hypothetical protein
MLLLLAGISYHDNAFAQVLKYNTIKSGKLSGKVIVQWIEPDLFVFLPDSKQPLTFTRNNGQKITPGRMLTDGGSIPRPIWILRSYSPWGFAPAFIVHDWLFTMKQCKLGGYERLTLNDSGLVMAEVMKTMIEAKKVEAGPLTVVSMHQAVVSPIARASWNRGKCNPPPPGMAGVKPIQEFEISF